MLDVQGIESVRCGSTSLDDPSSDEHVYEDGNETDLLMLAEWSSLVPESNCATKSITVEIIGVKRTGASSSATGLVIDQGQSCEGMQEMLFKIPRGDSEAARGMLDQGTTGSRLWSIKLEDVDGDDRIR